MYEGTTRHIWGKRARVHEADPVFRWRNSMKAWAQQSQVIERKHTRLTHNGHYVMAFAYIDAGVSPFSVLGARAPQWRQFYCTNPIIFFVFFRTFYFFDKDSCWTIYLKEKRTRKWRTFWYYQDNISFKSLNRRLTSFYRSALGRMPRLQLCTGAVQVWASTDPWPDQRRFYFFIIYLKKYA